MSRSNLNNERLTSSTCSCSRQQERGNDKKRSKGRPRFTSVLVENLPKSTLSNPHHLSQFISSSIKAAFKSTATVVHCEIFDSRDQLAECDADHDFTTPAVAEKGRGGPVAILRFPTHLEAKRATYLKRNTLDGKQLSIVPYKTSKYPGLFSSSTKRNSGKSRIDSVGTRECSISPIGKKGPGKIAVQNCATLITPPPMYVEIPIDDSGFLSYDAFSDDEKLTHVTPNVERSASTLVRSIGSEVMTQTVVVATALQPPPGFSTELDKVTAERDMFRKIASELMDRCQIIETHYEADKTVAIAEKEALHLQETRALKHQVAQLTDKNAILQLQIAQLEHVLRTFQADPQLTPKSTILDDRWMEGSRMSFVSATSSLSMFNGSQTSLGMPSSVLASGDNEDDDDFMMSLNGFDTHVGELVHSVVNNAIRS